MQPQPAKKGSMAHTRTNSAAPMQVQRCTHLGICDCILRLKLVLDLETAVSLLGLPHAE